VYDAEIILTFQKSGLAANEEWIPPGYRTDPEEILEIRRMELIPAVDPSTRVMRDLEWMAPRVGGTTYETIRLDEVMPPVEHHLNAGIAVDFGLPYLWRPITGRLPSPFEGVCPKVGPGVEVTVAVKNTGTAFTEDLAVILRCARVRTDEMLREVLGLAAYNPSFSLRRYEAIDIRPDYYARPAIPVALDNWEEFPGGLKQPVPKILPWITYATNKKATTPNEWYDFYHPDAVDKDWMALSWNLLKKEEAYLITHLCVWPHNNSRDARIFIAGRAAHPEFPTRPLPEWNILMPPSYMDTTVNEDLKRAGPHKLPMAILMHGVKGAIQVRDNGTSIPAGGVKVGVWGAKFVLSPMPAAPPAAHGGR